LTTTWSAPRVALLALLMLGCAHAHVFAAVMVGLAVFAIAARSDDRTRAVVAVVVAGLPALLLAVFVATRAAPVVGVWVNSDALERVSVVAWGFVGGPAWRAWPPVVVAVVGLAQGLRSDQRERAVVVVAAGLVLLAWVLPRDAPGWQLVSPRPLLLGLTLLLLMVEPARGRRRRPADRLRGERASRGRSDPGRAAHHRLPVTRFDKAPRSPPARALRQSRAALDVACRRQQSVGQTGRFAEVDRVDEL